MIGLRGKMKTDNFFWILVFSVLIFTSLYSSITIADPTGPDITNLSTETYTPKSAYVLNTSGGTFTTILINGTSQTYKWKAYIGNVSGGLSLSDADNYSIYDWTLTEFAGEVYATRKQTLVNWGNINCSNTTFMADEESALNINATLSDSIAHTFDQKIHKQFRVGSRLIPASDCYAIATNINNSLQAQAEDSEFQEILLYDGSYNIYTTIISYNTTGYDFSRYDFQLIVPEDPTSSNPNPYYFYVELS